MSTASRFNVDRTLCICTVRVSDGAAIIAKIARMVSTVRSSIREKPRGARDRCICEAGQKEGRPRSTCRPRRKLTARAATHNEARVARSTQAVVLDLVRQRPCGKLQDVGSPRPVPAGTLQRPDDQLPL